MDTIFEVIDSNPFKKTPEPSQYMHSFNSHVARTLEVIQENLRELGGYGKEKR